MVLESKDGMEENELKGRKVYRQFFFRGVTEDRKMISLTVCPLTSKYLLVKKIADLYTVLSMISSKKRESQEILTYFPFSMVLFFFFAFI